MTGITHQQAKRYLYASADGLLLSDQRILLDTHLRECGSCRMESEKLNTLETRLRQTFQARRNAQNAPSKNVMSYILSQTERVTVSHQINKGFKLLIGLTAFLVLLVLTNYVFRQLRNSSPVVDTTQTAMSSSTQLNRLISFVSTQDGNSEVYVMNADGTGIRNVTNNPAYDGNPIWSPDGSKIAFESDRNGNLDIFVVNADGSGLTQLTHDPANDILGASPRSQDIGLKTQDVWSPDGIRILFSNDRTGKWILYVMNADGSGVTQLAQANDPPVGETLWSPDGQQVAYTLGNANGWGQVIAVDIDGTNRREIATGDPAKGNNAWQTVDLIGWSQNEQFIYFEYGTDSGTWYVLKAAANGTNTSQEIANGYALAEGLYVRGWLENNSTLHYTTQETGGRYGEAWQRIDGRKALRWNPLEICGISSITYRGQYPTNNLSISSEGSQAILGVSCLNKGYSILYFLDSNTGKFNQISQIPVVWDNININWSADDQLILLNGNNHSTNKTEIYELNTDELQKKTPIRVSLIWNGPKVNTAIQPVLYRSITSKAPKQATLAPVPASFPLWDGTNNGDLIAFASNAHGNSDIYLEKNDGSHITELTHNSADESEPIWSPDGNWIAFISSFNNTYSLHIIRPDGSNDKKLVDTWVNPTWSPDSQKIAYLVSLPDNPSDVYSAAKISVKVIDLNGNVLQDTLLGVYNQAGQLKWSQDGQSLSYVVTRLASTPTGEMQTTESDLYQLKLGSDSPLLLLKSDKTIDSWITTGNNLTYLVRDIIEWDLFQSNGNEQKKLATFSFDQIQCSNGDSQTSHFTYNYGSENTVKNFSPNGKYISFQIPCDDGHWWLYLGSIDGKFFRLIDHPIDNYDLMNLLSWSSDSKNIVFAAGSNSLGNSNIYKLNVASAIQNPSIPLIPLTTSGFDEYSPVWQPQP